ncbi:glutathione S-transferase Mu 1 [Caerostris darwini]|uniref:glutathione transferase n=1 Tax=Caerostris darwini TaxID=1538125 RepID=A0AAV4PJW3_9ARAC|nr:glutathione S-transferase Mu 1 [Caerostris darwini]
MGKPLLGYWDLRGLAEPIRYLLHYVKVDFEDKRYQFTQDGWQKDKFALGLDFPNLPYYMEGDVKLTQSTAILRHLARKHGLDDFENAKAEFIKNIPAQLKLWEKFIGDHKFLTGDNLTYVDFIAYDVFDFYRLFHEGILSEFPILEDYQARIRSLPQLQEYLKSSTYKRWPIFGPIAKFGGAGDAPKHLGEYD